MSDTEKELAALNRAPEMLKEAAEVSKNNVAYVAINVLEKRDDKIKNSTYLFNKSGEVALF